MKYIKKPTEEEPKESWFKEFWKLNIHQYQYDDATLGPQCVAVTDVIPFIRSLLSQSKEEYRHQLLRKIKRIKKNGPYLMMVGRTVYTQAIEDVLRLINHNHE